MKNRRKTLHELTTHVPKESTEVDTCIPPVQTPSCGYNFHWSPPRPTLKNVIATKVSKRSTNIVAIGANRPPSSRSDSNVQSEWTACKWRASRLDCWAPIASPPGSASGPPAAVTLEFVRALLVTVMSTTMCLCGAGTSNQATSQQRSRDSPKKIRQTSIQTEVPPLHRPDSAINSSTM